MVDVAQSAERGLVEPEVAGSSPVVHPKLPPSLGGAVVSKTVVGGSSPSGGAICPNCASSDLAKIKGCVRCLTCGFKEDCNGW